LSSGASKAVKESDKFKSAIQDFKNKISRSIKLNMNSDEIQTLQENLAILKQLDPKASKEMIKNYKDQILGITLTFEPDLNSSLEDKKEALKALQENLKILEQLSSGASGGIKESGEFKNVVQIFKGEISRSIKLNMTKEEAEKLQKNLSILYALSPEAAKDDTLIEINSKLISMLANIDPGAALDCLAKEPKMLLNLDTYLKLINIEHSGLTAE
jgi:exonuclease VII large subunit